MASESDPKFRVAICGAGIGGLVLAITIGKYDASIPIDLYEAHDSIETAGVGISLWRQVHQVMIELGLLDDLKQNFTHNPDGYSGLLVRRSDIPEGGYLWFRRPQDTAPSTMHRQHMVAVLEKHLPASCTVHPRKRLVNYIEPEEPDTNSMSPIILEFDDGTTATTDVLIGADGVRSAVRKTLFETAAFEDGDQKTDLRQYVDATFSGTSTYRFLCSAEALKKENSEHGSLKDMTMYCGNGGYMVTYPVARGTLINTVILIGDPNLTGTRYEGHWVSEVTRDEVLGRFNEFEPDVRAVLKCCEKPSKWALHIVKSLPFCVRKRVALIGDACHAMTPQFGAGAGQAIDDAFVLGRLIAHPLMTLSRIPNAFQIYEQVRLPLAQHLTNISLSAGMMYLFMEPGYYDGMRKEEELDDRGIGVYEREGMEIIKQEMLGRWDWVDESKGGLQQWEEAESKLQELVGQVTN